MTTPATPPNINPHSQEYILARLLTELEHIKVRIDSLSSVETRLRAVETLSLTTGNEMTLIKSELHDIKAKVNAPPVSIAVKIAGWGAFCSLAISAITLLNILVK